MKEDGRFPKTGAVSVRHPTGERHINMWLERWAQIQWWREVISFSVGGLIVLGVVTFVLYILIGDWWHDRKLKKRKHKNV